MKNDQKIDATGQIISIRTHLLLHVIVLFLTLAALYFAIDKHYQKIESSILSMILVLSLVLASAMSVGIVSHALWKYIKYDKYT